MAVSLSILHVVSSIDLSSGGPSKSVCDLALNQAFLGFDVTIFTQFSDSPYFPVSPNPKLKLCFVKGFSFKSELKKLGNNHKFDILHGHGIWQLPVHFMSNWATEVNIPYVISPRGMLEPWALNVGKLKKKLAMAFYQKNDLANATCNHATSQMEFENIRNLGFTNSIAVIPNGIELLEFPIRKKLENKSEKTLLFLSRIHPKKGIELLVEAWSIIEKNKKIGWKVEVAGNGEDSYVKSLSKLISDKGLESEIKIIGPQFGEEKLSAYHHADLFVLPTYSENFGIVVAEALACGVPVITTKGAPWEELITHQAGWWIDIGVAPLVDALEKAISLSDHERYLMGRNGRKLIEDKYSIESVASQMISLYKWILGQGDKPDFVSIK